MDREQGLYAQMVLIRQRHPYYKEEKENTRKYNFQGQSSRSRRWFDFDHKWSEENFMTREPDFYKKCIKLNLGVMIKKYQIFGVQIGNAKITRKYSSTQQHK